MRTLKECLYLLAVVLELPAQFVRTLKGPLIAHTMQKPDLKHAAIEFTGETEDVDLDGLLVTVEGGTSADVQHAGHPLASHRLHGIDPTLG